MVWPVAVVCCLFVAFNNLDVVTAAGDVDAPKDDDDDGVKTVLLRDTDIADVSALNLNATEKDTQHEPDKMEPNRSRLLLEVLLERLLADDKGSTRNGDQDNRNERKGSTSSDSTGSSDDTVTSSRTESPCCLPPVWQGRLDQVVDDGSSIEATFHIDADGRRTRVDISLFDDPEVVVSQIVVYRKQIDDDVTADSGGRDHRPPLADIYTINTAAKICLHRRRPYDYPTLCIPDQAVTSGNFAIGVRTGKSQKVAAGVEGGGIGVERWRLHWSNGRVDEYLVEQDSCFPLVTLTYAQDFIDDLPLRTDSDEQQGGDAGGQLSEPTILRRRGAILETGYFTDVRTTIADQTVFDIPRYCD